MFFSVSAPWAPSRVDMCVLQIFIIIIIIIIKHCYWTIKILQLPLLSRELGLMYILIQESKDTVKQFCQHYQQ